MLIDTLLNGSGQYKHVSAVTSNRACLLLRNRIGTTSLPSLSERKNVHRTKAAGTQFDERVVVSYCPGQWLSVIYNRKSKEC